MSNQKLADKVVVVTGGSAGIGLATAQLFAQQGAHVYITGRRKDELDAVVKLIGRENVTAVRGDVSNMADLDRLYVKPRKIDLLFAYAGILESKPLGTITEEHFGKLFTLATVHLLLVLNCLSMSELLRSNKITIN